MKKKFIIIGFIIALIGFTGWFVFHNKKTPKVSQLAVSVALSKVKFSSIKDQVDTTGTISAINNTVISSKINGYVKSINYSDGQHVKKGTVLIQLDRTNETANLAIAKDTAAISHNEMLRDKKLLHRGLIQHEEYYQAELTDQSNEDNALNAQNKLDDTQIKAPFDGIMNNTTASIGGYITAGNPLSTITSLDKLSVHYALPAQYLAKIKVGQKVMVQSSDLPGRIFQATVSYIAPNIDSNTQTITVHANITNIKDELKPGLFVNVVQILGQPKRVMMVPTSSVLASLKGYYVYTVNNNKAKKVYIKLGERLPNQVEVLSGLTAGESIVTAGTDKLHTNSKVSVVK